MQYHAAGSASTAWDSYWFEKNLQGDIVAIYDNSGTKLVSYTYDAWGNATVAYHNGGENTSAVNNRFTYRGYYYDYDLGLYYLQSRYYDSNVGRFLNVDGYVSTGQGLLGYNMYAYCSNNPVSNIDPYGYAWCHWVIGAALVVGCAIVVVATAGSAAAGIAAVLSVANGVAAATTASTVAAGMFIGASVAYAGAAFSAISEAECFDDVRDAGDWNTVATTAFGGLIGGAYGYDMAREQLSISKKQSISSGTSRGPQKSDVPNSRYIQYDQSTGQIRSDVVYDANGNWYSRVDYMHYHNIDGVDYKPHIHFSAPLNKQGQPMGRETIIPW